MSNPHVAEWMLVLVCAPAAKPEPAGVLLLDPTSNRLFIKLKPSLDQIDESILEVWQDLAADLGAKAAVSGGAEVLNWLESTASNTIQVSERKSFEAADFETALHQLYIGHVDE